MSVMTAQIPDRWRVLNAGLHQLARQDRCHASIMPSDFHEAFSLATTAIR